MRKKYKVFVYGTLRPKGAESTHVVAGYTMFNYYNRFPYLVETGADEEIVGNILEVTAKELDALDHIEGIADGLFKRVVTEAIDLEDTGAATEVFMYVAGNICPPIIQSGDWLNRD